MNARPPLPSTFFEGKDRRKRGVFLNFFSSRRNVDKRPASRKFSRVLRLEENRHNIGIIILSDRWQRFHERRGTWKKFEGWPFHLAPVIRPLPFHEPSGLWHFEFLFLSHPIPTTGPPVNIFLSVRPPFLFSFPTNLSNLPEQCYFRWMRDVFAPVFHIW